MKRNIALLLALGADATQWLITPLLAFGGIGLFLDVILDIFMAITLTVLRGFHWAYLPTFIAKLIPGVNLVPFWTTAVLITWKQDTAQSSALLATDRPPVLGGQASPVQGKNDSWKSSPRNVLIIAIAVVIVSAIACITFLKSHFTKENIHEVGDQINNVMDHASEDAAKVAKAFKTGTITSTFISTATKIESSNGDVLELATLDTNEDFKKEDAKRIAWGWIYLGTTVSEIHAPVTYRYHIQLSDAWHLAVQGNVCIVQAPQIRPSLPPAIHIDQMEMQTKSGWLRFNSSENLDALKKSITAELETRSMEHLSLVRDKCRQAVASFVKNWLMREDQWRNDRFTAIIVVFPDEVALNSDQDLERLQRLPTIELDSSP